MTGDARDPAAAPGLRRSLRVRAVAPGSLTLEAPRAAACGACAARAGCGAGALAELVGGTAALTVPCDAAPKAGDHVEVEMAAGVFLGVVLRAYLWPVVGVVVLAIAALAAGLPDWLTAALSLPVMAACWWPLRRAEKAARHAAPVRIVTSGAP